MAKGKTQPAKLVSEGSTWFDKLAPQKKDFVCVIGLLTVIYILFFKIITSNMIFSDSGDTAAAHSWGKAIEHIKETEHVDPLWIPFIFSGMPIAGALIFPRDVNYTEFLIQLPGKLLFLNADMAWFVLHYFLMGVFMYLLARQMKFAHLPSLFAAITLMINPYAIGLAQGGHGSKLMTLSFIPLVFLLTLTLFEKRNFLSLGLLSAATGTMFLNRHPQIAFYGLLVIGCYIVYEVVLDIRKEPLVVSKKVLLLGLALIIGFGIYSYEFLPTQGYTPYSIRGGGGEIGTSNGLDYDYATSWSFHPFEMMNYIIPSFFGFSTPFYWGWMPFNDSTVYIGILPIFLSIIVLVYRRTRLTWFVTIFSAIMFLISFGRYFGLLYNLMFNYFPYFNKFRVPVMILHLMPLTFGILAAAGLMVLSEMQNNSKAFNLEKFRKGLIVTLVVIGGVLILGFIANDTIYSSLSGFMFQRGDDLQQLRQQYGAQAQQVFGQLKRMRFDLLWKDYIKFALIAGASIGLLLLYIKRRLKFTVLYAGFLLILLIDLFLLDVKFIDPKPNTAIEESFLPDQTVNFFKSDSGLYRIFPIGDLFQDNTFMYHAISSIGGYSPAKLKIYQELIESCLYRGSDPQFPINMNVVNMLNAKYLVAKGRLPEGKFSPVSVDQSKGLLTYFNLNFLPRAWFVDTAVISHSKAEIFMQMNSASWNPRTTAILEKEPSVKFTKSDSMSVVISKLESRNIALDVFSSKTSLLVLSEVYYPVGWKAYIDGTETEIYKTNYVLRSIVIPTGKHNIEFRFDPPVYQTGLTITQSAWGITIVLIIIGLVRIPQVRQKLGFIKRDEVASQKAVTPQL